MAKRLTKALRPKRRWIGLSVPVDLPRKEVEARIEAVAPAMSWRLMDCRDGRAILRIRLADEAEWRQALADRDAEIHSLTMSGKIRLVRERLELPRPRRR